MSDFFKGDFLGNLPRTFNPKQRIAFEAIGFSIEAVHLRYCSILDQLSQYNDHEILNQIPALERVNLFSNIWSMIDQAHAINQLLYQSAKKNKGAKADDFGVSLEGTKVASAIEEYHSSFSGVLKSLRDNMDHLAGNLDKLAAKKGSQDPMYGSLSYILSNPEGLSNKKMGVVVLSSGSFIREKHNFNAVNPANLGGKSISVPVDHLELSAFGYKIDLSELYHKIMQLKHLVNTEMAKIFEKEFKKYADDKGIKYEDMFMSLPGAFTGYMQMKLVSEEELQEITKNASN
ncbi:MAG: hypothetical protein ACRBDI_07370 [Alphaproteobacteria bacterium]